MEIKSPNAGKISKFHVQAGENLDVGKPFFDIDSDAEKPSGSSSSSPDTQSSEKKDQESKKEEPKQ